MFLRSKENSFLNFGSFKKNFIEKLKNYQSAEEKPSVLILGSTGSAKSTFVNYMLGCQMQEYRNDEVGQVQIIPKAGQKEICKIGHKYNSETFYPQSISSKKNYNFIDCPAFDYNVLTTDRVTGTALTQLAINQTSNISGLVLCLTMYTLHDENAFYRVTDALIKSVKNFSEVASSILLLVTRPHPQLEPVHIHNQLKDYAKLEEQGKIYNKNNARLLLKLVTDYPNNLHIFRPLEEKDRDNIFFKIQQLKPIDKTQLTFPIYDIDHKQLQIFVENAAVKVNDLFKKREALRLSVQFDPKINKDIERLDYTIKNLFTSDTLDLLFIYKIATVANFDSDSINTFIKNYELYKKQEIPEEKAQTNHVCRIM